MKIEPNNTKVKEMYTMLNQEIEREESEVEIEDETDTQLSSNKFMKLNEYGEFYYSDVEDGDENEDEDDVDDDN